MNNIFFTSDHHFGHKLVTKNRNFNSPDEMNRVLVNNWNSVVKSNDEVYYLGDFSFLSAKDTLNIANLLNGKIYFVLGNHDRYIKKKPDMFLERFEWIRNYHELKYDNKFIILSHYCFHIWNRHHYGSWHLYGHSHGNLIDNSNRKRIDIGIDCFNLTPVRYDTIQELIDKKTISNFDHHI